MWFSPEKHWPLPQGRNLFIPVMDFTTTLHVNYFNKISDNVYIRTPELVEVHYKHQTEDIPVNPHLSIFVAAFTTCWARLRLYEALELLGHRVLYFDTDSVVFIEHPDDPNEPQPVLGNYLGVSQTNVTTVTTLWSL